FTTVSEQLDPAELVSVLNGYLGPMTEIILEEGGTIDKYIGDAIVAMWGAPLDQPDHAQRACRAAVRCQLKLEEIRRACAAKGLPELHVRIGLNSGEALVGNLGSESRFDYTMIGDTVNLAARLEGANSVYGTRILCGERTLELARGAVELRELDLLQVKGKTRGVRVAEVAALSGALEGPTADRFARFAEALAALRAREFERAKSSFEVLAAEGDAPSAVMAERCAEWLAQPPPPTWDGSYKLTTK
ncbi:MAG: hypothetical protein RL653_834, partial [Pseudomonadota bacterium]